ncbi:MAG: sugar kinase [Saprospiraceae bacterium]|nr:sugar kinase [Saprospiraceae bacterium]
MSLLTVGTVAFDTIETPYGVAEKVVGGSCTYVSMAASYFTKDINLCAVVGDDFPQSELGYMKANGVNLDGLEIKKGEKSFFWHGRYHKDMIGRDTLVTDLNVLADFNPILPDSYKTSDFVMLGNLTPSVQMSVLTQMTKKPKFIALDTMNFWMDIAMQPLLKVIKKVHVLIINDEEARQLSGERSLRKAATKILTMGPKYLIIKKGEHGAMLFHKDEVFYVPALPLEEVFDPTGAGDTFAGGFMGYITSTGKPNFENMKRGIIYGSALASFCVEKFSTEGLKNLTQEEIKSRVSQFTKMVKVKI